MRYALIDGERTEPSPKARGSCELCQAPVHAKCGAIVVWHWAHTHLDDCDTWAERDTAWHRAWQDLVPAKRREVTIGKHRADIITPDGVVVEIQHSYLPADVIRQREEHYGRMVWVYDATEAYAADRFEFRKKKGYYTFRWKHPRKTLTAARSPVFLDLGKGLIFRMKTIHADPGRPCRGSGQFWTLEDMRRRLNQEMILAA